LTTLVGLWLVRFLLEHLGQTEYGLWLIAGQILGYLSLLDLGVVALLPREAAYATGQLNQADQDRGVREIVGRFTHITLLQTPLVGLIALVVWLQFPADWEPLRAPIGLVLIAFTVTFPLRVLDGVLNGLQDFAFLGTVHTVSWLVNTATVVALLLSGFGLHSLAIGWIVGQGIRAILAGYRLQSTFPDQLPRRLGNVTLGDIKAVFSRGIWISMSQIAHVLFAATDVILIGAIISPAAAVPYAITGKLISVFANYPQSLLQLAQTGLSQLRVAEEKPRVLQAVRALGEGTLILSGGLVCAVLAANESFVYAWLGEEQWGGLLLTALILTRVVLLHWTLSFETVLFSFGRERRLAITAFSSGVLVMLCSVYLIANHGIIGAPIGAILGLTLITVPFHLVGLARDTETPILQLITPTVPWCWRFGLILCLAGLAAEAGPYGLFGLAGIAALVCTVYALMMASRFVMPPLDLYLHAKLRSALALLPSAFRNSLGSKADSNEQR